MLTSEQCAAVWAAIDGETFVEANGAHVVAWRSPAHDAYTLFTHEQFIAGPLLTLDSRCQEAMRDEMAAAAAAGAVVVFCSLTPSPRLEERALLGDHWGARMSCWQWPAPAPRRPPQRVRRSGRLRGLTPK